MYFLPISTISKMLQNDLPFLIFQNWLRKTTSKSMPKNTLKTKKKISTEWNGMSDTVIISFVCSLLLVWLCFFFRSFLLSDSLIEQWKLLNVITLGQAETDNINRMITLSVITLSGFHCTNNLILLFSLSFSSMLWSY